MSSIGPNLMPSWPQIRAAVISTVMGGSPATSASSSRAKTASSATAGCVRRYSEMSAFSAVMISVEMVFIRQVGGQLDDFGNHQNARLQTFGRAEIRN